MTTHLLTSLLDRRRLTRIALGAAALATTDQGGASATPRTPTPAPDTTDCSAEPGVQLFIDWKLGKPVMTIEELLPPIDWVMYSNPAMPLIFRYPPDWTPQALFCESFTTYGAPNWTDKPVAVPQLTLARVMSPEKTAAYEFVSGNVQGMPLTVSQAALVAAQGILGENPRLQLVCGSEHADTYPMTWLWAVRSGAELLLTAGVAIDQPSFVLPATTMTYENYLGPREEFEPLMREVFLRIQFQFLHGGGDEPTPTPEE